MVARVLAAAIAYHDAAYVRSLMQIFKLGGALLRIVTSSDGETESTRPLSCHHATEEKKSSAITGNIMFN